MSFDRGSCAVIFRFELFLSALVVLACQPLDVEAAPLDAALAKFEQATPREAAGFAAVSLPALNQAAREVEEAVAAVARFDGVSQPARALNDAQWLLAAKSQVDRRLDATLGLRNEMLDARPAETRRAAIHNYVRVTNQLIDLSGRLRYLSFDGLKAALARLPQDAERQQLVDKLIAFKSSIGASVAADLLLDPAPNGGSAGPSSPALRVKILQLITATGQNEALPQLARFVTAQRPSAALMVQAAETIRAVGLPQDPRPGQDPELPAGPITAVQLHAALAHVSVPPGDAALRERLNVLLAWLDKRKKEGFTEESYRLGQFDVRPGDWLLMRNPSPYNLFTDLSPGLFTHVGVATVEQGSDGLRRLVLIDMPERGRIPATNVETFVKRSRHYVFVRHRDPEIARKMSEAAGSIIGNETMFDLNFRTDRVPALAGQSQQGQSQTGQSQKSRSLTGKKIHTYCAGLLLLCALHAGAERQDMFPVTEAPAGGHTQENLKKLGMSIGEDLISPTGALFSRQLTLVGRREPMYEPTREIDEAVFDHFALGLRDKTLTVSPSLYQSLRLKLAEASRENQLLADAITAAVGVARETDLVAAAQATAVIALLDEVTYGASADYTEAQAAIRTGALPRRPTAEITAEDLAEFQKYRERHAQLLSLWEAGRLPPRALRIELVKYYIAQGQRQIDQRFFSGK